MSRRFDRKFSATGSVRRRSAAAGFLLVVWAGDVRAQSAAPATAASADPARAALLAEVRGLGLPPLTYAGESRVRFEVALRKIDLEKRRRLVGIVDELKRLDREAPSLLPYLAMRYVALGTLPGPDDGQGSVTEPDRKSPVAVLRKAALLELASGYLDIFEDAQRRGQKLEWDSSVSYLQTFATRYPGDPDVAYVFRRRLEALTPGDERDRLEKAFRTTYAGCPAVRQYDARAGVGRPIALPFDRPGGPRKPTLVHFWSPESPGRASHLKAVAAAAVKYAGQVEILCVPVGVDADAARSYCRQHGLDVPQVAADRFVADQGLTPDDVPLSYLIAADGTLASVRDDARIDRPLARLLGR